MIHRSAALASVLVWTAVPATAWAQPDPIAPMFGTRPVSDIELTSVRGTASPYAALSRRGLSNLADTQSRSDFRVTGSVATLQMEAWWGTIGSELIANAVRNRF